MNEVFAKEVDPIQKAGTEYQQAYAEARKQADKAIAKKPLRSKIIDGYNKLIAFSPNRLYSALYIHDRKWQNKLDGELSNIYKESHSLGARYQKMRNDSASKETPDGYSTIEKTNKTQAYLTDSLKYYVEKGDLDSAKKLVAKEAQSYANSMLHRVGWNLPNLNDNMNGFAEKCEQLKKGGEGFPLNKDLLKKTLAKALNSERNLHAEITKRAEPTKIPPKQLS